MEPVRTPLVTEKSLALCNFVCVVGESVVNAAAVNVKIFTAVLVADARTFNVPARITDTPRTLPLEFL